MYSFEPDEEQKMLVDVISRYAAGDLRPTSLESEESGEIPEQVIRKGWEIGMIQASVPAEWGGFGDHSALTGVLALEAMSYGDAAGTMAVFAPGLFVYPILLAGSEQQKSSFLPEILDSPWKPYSAALLEASFDFDPDEMQTSAHLDDECYVLNGEKAFVPFAAEAEAILVYASLDGQPQGFIVRREAPGMTVQERQKTLGFNGLPVYRLKLDSVQIPIQDRLGGPEGHPWESIMASFHLANSAIALGVAKAAFEYSRDYAKDRDVFGVKVAQKQAIAFMLAEMATDLEAARLLTWEAAWLFDRQKEGWSKQAYLADRCTTDVVMMVTDRAVQILGGHGYIREHPVELWMRNGRGFSSLAGLAMV